MKVLIADAFEKSGIAGLTGAGCEVISEPELKGDALEAAIRRTAADVLVVRSTKVTEPMLDAGRLSLIVRAGAGYNTIDVAAASQRGIYVSNCPGKNAIAVAELAFGLMLALDRRIADNVADLRAGKWNKKEFSRAQGLYGSTLGLLGAGSIGQEMIRRAAGFGLNVVLWSRRFDGQERPLTEAEARAKFGNEVNVAVHPMSRNDRAVTEGSTAGFIKLVTRRKHILGAHIVGPAAGELTQTVALAMKCNLPTFALSMVTIYPAVSYGLHQVSDRASMQALKRHRFLRTMLKIVRKLALR